MRYIFFFFFHYFPKQALLLVMILLLVQAKTKAQIPDDIAMWLKKNNADIRYSINQYDFSRFNVLIDHASSALNGYLQRQDFKGSTWEVYSKAEHANNIQDAVDFSIRFKCISGHLRQSAVAADIDFSSWSEKNYVLLPGAVYNGNRFEWRRLRYSPKLYEVQDIGIDKPIIVSDIPKLSESGGVSRIQERSGSMSTPAIGFRADSSAKGIWILTHQGNSLGDYGINIEENRARDHAIITINSPVVHEQYTYFANDAHYPSQDKPHDFNAGDEVIITFRMYGFEAPEVQSLFNKLTIIRKDLVGDSSITQKLTFSESMRTLEDKFNKVNFVDKYGYYSVGLRENFLQDWQIGWTGGMISTYPLLFAGNTETRRNVLRNFDWLFLNGISPSGFYYDAGKDGTIWYGGDIRKPHTHNWHLIRKSADAVYYITKQFMLMQKMGVYVKPYWKDGNKKVCDAFVNLWYKNHQIGQFIDSNTGEIVVGGSSSGGILPAALALASQYYRNPAYMDVAKQVAGYYNENFTRKGITCGGPGDALQNIDSESSYALVESYTTLYELTGDKQWLNDAENAARQFSSWVVSYNYKFPAKSSFDQIGIRTTGAVYANTQNKHAAPAICTFSGQALLKLYRFTGDVFYIGLLYDVAHNMPQYLPHPENKLEDATYGYMSERISMTDWQGLDKIGALLKMSTWAETGLMLTNIEIPGLYVCPDDNYFVAFDSIVVTVKSQDEKQLILQLKNPTKVVADVSVLEDKAKNKIMGENYLYGCDKVNLKPGETKELIFKKSVLGQGKQD
ncbi:hypothetical protein [uncultured Mucilaginibacter sp.]|uniref:hypothetical protein n=1 Tax=uncultured Mucilaginibacter sp. TaxID=797541 RepID=UPI0025D0B7C0|nr:hypothetical protein [uncultured Mucilaginibacter sp.]